MSQVYAVEILLVATAYIRADSPEEAAGIAAEEFSYATDATVSRRTTFGEVEVSEEDYTSEDLPDVSLSPALTFYGPAAAMGSPGDFAKAAGAFECVHDA